MKISDDVLKQLCTVQISENEVRLASPGLERGLYLKVDKVLRELGGKWISKRKAHVFDSDPSDAIEAIILTGEYSSNKDFGFFATPPRLARHLVDLASFDVGQRALEPNAGQGALIEAILEKHPTTRVVAYELLQRNFDVLQTKFGGNPNVELHLGDFLQTKPDNSFDRIVMNPPFAKRQDLLHVQHAFGFLNDSGRLVTVLSGGVEFREDKLTNSFRAGLKAAKGRMTKLPAGSFRESGTDVRACVAVIPAQGARSDKTALDRISELARRGSGATALGYE